MTWTCRKKLQEVAELFDAPLRTVEKWRAMGMPGGRQAWHLLPIIEWLYTEGPRGPQLPEDADPEMRGGSGSSPGLERYRIARAKREEIALLRERRELMSLDEISDGMDRIFRRLRTAGDSLKRRGFEESHQILAEAIEDMTRQFTQLLEQAGELDPDDLYPEEEQPSLFQSLPDYQTGGDVLPSRRDKPADRSRSLFEGVQ